MKRIISSLLLIALCISLSAEVGEKKYVAVEKSYLKSSTWFFARKIEVVTYGQSVEIISEKGNWVKVKMLDDSSVTGWISEKSLTSKKIVLRNDTRLSTSTEELALAGKGFTKEIENIYKEEFNIDFSLVDNMENSSIQEEDLLDFIKEGSLRGSEQ